MQTALITGGAGFIGTHLAEALIPNYKVIIFDNFRRDSLQYAPHLKSHPNVETINGDILEYDSIKSAMAGADIVVHMAAIAGVSSYYSESVKTLKVNILGTVNVLEAMLETGTKKLIDFSTSEVYGSSAENVDEECNHGIGPVSQKRWVYAVSKIASEHLSLRYGEEYRLDCSCVRPFNIYGPRQTGEGAICNFAKALLHNKPIQIYGDGSDIRAWCYVSDIVDSVLKILNTKEASGHTFNIGNPSAVVSTLDLAKLMVEIHGSGEIQMVEKKHVPIRTRSPNIQLAQNVLNYNPSISLENGIKNALQWYQEVGL